MGECPYRNLCDKCQFFVKGQNKAGCIQGYGVIYFIRKKHS